MDRRPGGTVRWRLLDQPALPPALIHQTRHAGALPPAVTGTVISGWLWDPIPAHPKRRRKGRPARSYGHVGTVSPLAPLLERAGILEPGIEVVFWAADSGEVTIRDNSGVIGPGRSDQLNRNPALALDAEQVAHRRAARRRGSRGTTARRASRHGRLFSSCPGDGWAGAGGLQRVPLHRRVDSLAVACGQQVEQQAARDDDTEASGPAALATRECRAGHRAGRIIRIRCAQGTRAASSGQAVSRG